MAETRPIYSSWISQLSHDPDTNTMTVHYSKGGSTTYPDVSFDEFDSLSRAPSVGEAIHARFRAK